MSIAWFNLRENGVYFHVMSEIPEAFKASLAGRYDLEREIGRPAELARDVLRLNP